MKTNFKFIKYISIFAIIIYLIMTIFFYIISPKIVPYEVNKGSINDDRYYVGIATYKEEVIKASESGIAYYFASEGDKIKNGENIYSISNSSDMNKLIDKTKKESSNNENQLLSIINSINSFNNYYDSNNFNLTYNLGLEINKKISDLSNDDLINIINQNIDVINSSGFVLYPSTVSGIITYNIDNMENLTSDDINNDNYKINNYSVTDTRNNKKIKEGDDICKIITSEEWDITLNIDESTYKKLSKKTENDIKILFTKDNNTEWAKFSIDKKNNYYYCTLHLDKGLIRYYQDRFVNLKLILQNEVGLKVPTSALLEKDFFKIPSKCIMTGKDSSKKGVLASDINGDYVFKEVTIYYVDIDEDITYINIQTLNIGDKLLYEDSTKVFTIDKMSKLTGVYNINNGYSLFRRVDILYQDKEFAIVKEDIDYGIICFDQIARNPKDIKDNNLIY